jgi:hypothetical protein
MVFGKVKKKLSFNFQQLFGESVAKKYVILESDDWGGIRIPSKRVYDELEKSNPNLSKDAFCRFDTLESKEDLDVIVDLLSSFQDRNGRSPILTCNMVMANPDFEKIKESRYAEYFYEPFDQTLDHLRPGTYQFFSEAISNGLLFPQFHASEHVQVIRWLSLLRAKESFVSKAFDLDCFGIFPDGRKSEYLMATYDLRDQEEKDFGSDSLKRGLEMFEQQFGFKSQSFIPPCYIASDEIIELALRLGTVGLQGKMIQLSPSKQVEEHQFNRVFRRAGAQGKRVNLVRNAFFEPSTDHSFPWVKDVINRAEAVFFWNRPLVISTHRINYVSGLDICNRDKGIALLKSLIHALLERWPDIEFITSAELVSIYKKQQSERGFIF